MSLQESGMDCKRTLPANVVFLSFFQVKTPKKEFGPFCGKTVPPKIETRSHSVGIQFITDLSGIHTGWKIRYNTTGR